MPDREKSSENIFRIIIREISAIFEFGAPYRAYFYLLETSSARPHHASVTFSVLWPALITLVFPHGDIEFSF